MQILLASTEQSPASPAHISSLLLGRPLPLLRLDPEFFQLLYTLRLGHLQRPVLLRQGLKFPNQLSSIQLLLFCLVQLSDELLPEMQGTGQRRSKDFTANAPSKLYSSGCSSHCLPYGPPMTCLCLCLSLSLSASLSILTFSLAYKATGFLQHGILMHLSCSPRLPTLFPHCTLCPPLGSVVFSTVPFKPPFFYSHGLPSTFLPLCFLLDMHI